MNNEILCRGYFLRLANNIGNKKAAEILIEVGKENFVGCEESYNDLLAMFTDPNYLNKPNTWFIGY